LLPPPNPVRPVENTACTAPHLIGSRNRQKGALFEAHHPTGRQGLYVAIISGDFNRALDIEADTVRVIRMAAGARQQQRNPEHQDRFEHMDRLRVFPGNTQRGPGWFTTIRPADTLN
jgi:hypothetical protein